MKAINLKKQNKNFLKSNNNFDLKHLGILSNSEHNNILNLNKESENILAQKKYYNSPNRIINNDEKIRSKILDNNEEKIKYIIKNKSINNSLTGNYFFPLKNNHYSYSKIKLSEKAILSESDKKISDKKEIKEKENKNKNIRLYLQSKTIDVRHNLNKDRDKNDLFPQFQKSNKKKDFKMLFVNKKLNFNNKNTKSPTNYTTLQSTLTTFSPITSLEKDIIMRKDHKENTFRNINKKKINNVELSELGNNNINDIKKFSALIKYRKNYPFILNPKPLIPKKFDGLPSSVIKMNNKYSNILKKENEKVFRQYFSIIGKEKFSKKFQNIVNKYEISEKKDIPKKKTDDNGNEEDNYNSDNSLVDENIISGTKLLREINQDQNKEKNILKKTNKKLLFKKFKKAMILLYLKLDLMSVYLGEILTNYKNPKNCFGFNATHDLFFSIKTKNLKIANIILDNNKYIVLDYDYFSMTALHWAAKYNFYQIIPKIVEYGSQVDKKNYIGDTPLLISVKHNFIESTIFLLLNFSSPFIKDSKGKSPLDYCKNEFKMKNIFNKIISLYYISILGPTKNSLNFISREFIEYIVNENKGDLELEAYNIIKEKYEYYKRKNKNQKL